jgi:outer membrane lipoprotein-sorting protein
MMALRLSWLSVCLGAAAACLTVCFPVRAEQAVQGPPDSVGPAQRAISEQQIFAELVGHNQIRSDALLGYSASRTYTISSSSGKVHAEIAGRMKYRAPDSKEFVITTEAGSGLVRSLALKPLIATEIRAAGGKDRHDSAITPANYRLELAGEEDVRNHQCYVLRAFPRRVDKYLFIGKLWIDKQDFAVVRIEGRPAANLSFWIKHVEFVRDYERVHGFWLPLKDETSVEVRIYGRKVLTIEHQDYVVAGRTLESHLSRSGGY